MHFLFPANKIHKGTEVYPLGIPNRMSSQHPSGGTSETVHSYMRKTNATALLVIRNGNILIEEYGDGNTASTLWASRSMAKSFTSTLLGAAIADGAIEAVEDSIAKYIPELEGSYYGTVTIKQALQMTSGVPFNETYSDPNSDVARLQACTHRRIRGCFLALLSSSRSLPPSAVSEPGSIMRYSSLDTLALGLVIERATGRTLADYLSDKIWKPFGMESEGYWNTEADGGATFSASGISATLRDYGRFGLFILNEIDPSGRPRTLPERWMKDALSASSASIRSGTPYGYQWWLSLPESHHGNGDLPGTFASFYALGNRGQVLAVDPARRLVIVKWAAWGPGEQHWKEDAALFAEIQNQFH